MQNKSMLLSELVVCSILKQELSEPEAQGNPPSGGIPQSPAEMPTLLVILSPAGGAPTLRVLLLGCFPQFSETCNSRQGKENITLVDSGKLHSD